MRISMKNIPPRRKRQKTPLNCRLGSCKNFAKRHWLQIAPKSNLPSWFIVFWEWTNLCEPPKKTTKMISPWKVEGWKITTFPMFFNVFFFRGTNLIFAGVSISESIKMFQKNCTTETMKHPKIRKRPNIVLLNGSRGPKSHGIRGNEKIQIVTKATEVGGQFSRRFSRFWQGNFWKRTLLTCQSYVFLLPVPSSALVKPPWAQLIRHLIGWTLSETAKTSENWCLRRRNFGFVGRLNIF